ncbi:receptor-type tyrosine-protein phosphatase beta isoform X2 [Cataglyphis hispanica]|uniref:receptor-type tyrosine-protein phosphatase beta isoform X2 n=1 Tax=Cataglyphis hispanica TaxID=1086592 RepID=UPI00217FB3E8|nr:receptor-type tyrosine-protein phosphatase beta isoform X2 [Cataglyphis hispanica]
MILENFLVLFIVVFCAFCDDGASQETTISTFESNYDSGSTINLISYDTESAKDITNFSSNDSEPTENLTIANYESSSESTIKFMTTNSQLDTDDFSSSSIIDQTTQSKFTTVVYDNVTLMDNSTICDPMWPINASVDTREVIDLKINNKSTEWIALSWESPCNDATDSMSNVSIIYRIEICVGENCNQTNETDTWYNATDLDPCTSYTFTVKVLTDCWESDGVTLSETTDYNISEIGDVLDLSVNVSVHTIRLTWQPPVVHEKCVSNYFIIQCVAKLCNNSTVLATNYIASNLEPCTRYYFTIKTITQTVQSAGVNKTVRTASPKLLEVQNLTITSGNFSLFVEWNPPQYDTLCLKHYHVTINKYFDENTTETSIQIPKLHACATYQVYVNAVNKNDVDGNTATKSGTTLESRTNPPESHTPSLPIRHVNNITIIWMIKKENNQCILETIVTICNETGSNGSGYEPEGNHAITQIDKEKAAASIVVVNTTVDNLSPFTNFICWAHTVNAAGYSELSHGINVTTLESVPSPPKFMFDNITDSQFTLNWDPPEYLPGNLEEFEIIINWKPLYPIPNWCPREESKNSIKHNVSGSTFDYSYLEAKAYTNYTVCMRARTGAGWSDCSISQNVETDSIVPEAISKFNSSSIIIKENSRNSNVLDTIVMWGLPCSLNGEFEFFNVSVYGTRDKYPPHSLYKIHKCMEYIDNDYMCLINLNELKGEYNYTFSISTKVMNVDTLSKPMSEKKLYPAGIPPQPDDDYIKSITIDPYKARRSTTTASILLPLFPDTNGDIKYYAIMVSKKGYNNVKSSTRFDLKNKIWPNVSSWEEAMIKKFSITYQATWPQWDSYRNHIAEYGNIRAIKYTIGEDIDCKEISSNTDEQLYCNGPLKPDTWYHVRMRAFTYGGYTDSDVFLIKTNAELNVALVIGTVFGILVVGILITMMLLVRKCSPYIVLRRFLHSDMPGSPVPAPFTRKKFISHCQQLVDNPGKLSNEFRLLQTLSVDLQMPTNTACLQANRKKNRYSDILPYDFSRVKLEVIDNDPNTDYINASFIRGYTGEDEYIACQGPKEETTYDFWRMVDQYNINIIVMLTQLVEKGKEKCHQYYPTIRETFRYENMTIRCTSELDFRTHTQRTLVLQKENKKRNITHLHFKDWPDHDVPEDFDAMINFCQIIRRNISANKGFIVVHCSAGIGRTGTLIAIDILLQHLRDNRKLDVFGTVYRLRHHRINMVQRESQYAYIYNCIKQVLKNPYFLKTYKPPPVDPIYENISKIKDTTNSDTNLVNNLETLKKHNSISMESLESIYNLFPWSTKYQRRNVIDSGLRQYKSMGSINIKTRHISVGKSRTLDCVIYKSLNNSSYRLSKENLKQENFPLLTCSRSAQDILGDNTQYAMNNM